MKNRKHKTFTREDRPHLIIGAVVFASLALHGLGASSEEIVQLLSAGLLLAAIVYAFYKLSKGFVHDIRYMRHLKSRKDGKDIDTMSGVDFERFIASILKTRGCSNVTLTEYYDLGIDIIAVKDGVTWGIQTKRNNGLVKVEAVRQAVGALKQYECDRAMVITNSIQGYSKPAKALAKSNNCILIERKDLAKWVKEYDANLSGAMV